MVEVEGKKFASLASQRYRKEMFLFQNLINKCWFERNKKCSHMINDIFSYCNFHNVKFKKLQFLCLTDEY